MFKKVDYMSLCNCGEMDGARAGFIALMEQRVHQCLEMSLFTQDADA